MKDLFEVFENLSKTLECLIEDYRINPNPETMKLIKEFLGLILRLGKILNGYGTEAD